MCLGPVTAAELRGDRQAAEACWLHIQGGFNGEERKIAYAMARTRRVPVFLVGVTLLGLLLTACGYGPLGAPTTGAVLQPGVVSAAGDITAAVERYRTLLGPDNGGDPGSKPTGRYECDCPRTAVP